MEDNVKERTPSPTEHSMFAGYYDKVPKLIEQFESLIHNTQIRRDNLSFEDLEKIRTMCRFSVFHYVFRWIKAPIISHSAHNDLSFLKEMCDFEDQKVAETAIRKMTRHLWYLRPELMGATLFDRYVSNDEKEEIRFAIMQNDEPRAKVKPMKSWFTKRDSFYSMVAFIKPLRLADFASKDSLIMFQLLDSDTDFLASSARYWNECEDESYMFAKAQTNLLNPVNDAAERACALVKYVKSHPSATSREKLKQIAIKLDQERKKERERDLPEALEEEIFDDVEEIIYSDEEV